MELIIKSKVYGYQTVFFDAEDESLVNSRKWGLKKGPNSFYAISGNYPNKKAMHRMIMNCPPDKVVDHMDGNGLNNMRSNLRICSQFDNIRSRKIDKRNTTGFKGVTKTKWGFQAQVFCNGKCLYGGLFKTTEEAAKRYNEMALIHFGEFAKLNKIETNE